MSTRRAAALAAVVGIGTLASLALTAASSWAAGGTVMCIKPGSAVLAANSHGACPPSYTATLLGAEGKEGKQGPEGKEGKEGPEGKNALSEEELSTLKGILPCIKSVSSGIDGKPTVRFSGCNVQIVNGMGKTASTNGEGNLVLGYDEHATVCIDSGEPPPCHPTEVEVPVPYTQTGSHDLMLGTGNSFTSYGSAVGGEANDVSGPFAVALGGKSNTALGEYSATLGGFHNTASGLRSVVSGGLANTAGGIEASVSGGTSNTAAGGFSSVQGGDSNEAQGLASSIFGGAGLIASEEFQAIP